jgi:hypothetical protein
MQSAQGRILRPHTVLELVDHTFRIYRDSFTKFVAPVAAVTVPITVITLVSSYALTNNLAAARTVGRSAAELNQVINGTFRSSLLLLGVVLVLQFIQIVIVNSVLTYLASERHLGRSVTIGEAFNAVKNRFLSVGVGLFLFAILMGALYFGLAFVIYCFGLAIPALIWLGVSMYAFLIPVLTLERTGITEGMNRAWALAKARFWPVFGFSAAVGIIYLLIYFALSLTGLLLVRGTVTSASFGAGQILETLLQTVVTIFLSPILPIGFTVLYYDTRVRLEGLDIALESVNTPDPRPSDLVSPPPIGPTFSRTDLTNVLILLAVCVLIVVLVAGVVWLVVRGSGF